MSLDRSYFLGVLADHALVLGKRPVDPGDAVIARPRLYRCGSSLRGRFRYSTFQVAQTVEDILQELLFRGQRRLPSMASTGLEYELGRIVSAKKKAGLRPGIDSVYAVTPFSRLPLVEYPREEIPLPQI